jgi:hypothetical protein
MNVASQRSDRNDSGASLIELTVVSGMLVIVLTMAMVGLSRLTTAFADTSMRTENLQEGMILMNVITKDLRTAARNTNTSSPFLEVSNGAVTFYANLNTEGETERKQIRIHVDTQSQQIFETVTPPEGGDGVVRTVGRYVTNNPLERPIFSYYGSNGDLIEPAADGSVDPGSWSDIEAVKVDLWIRKSTNRSMPSTEVTSRVRMPNLDYTEASE